MSDITPALTRQLARFAVAPHDFPELARQRARDAIADCIGCTIAGGSEPLAAPLAAVVPSFGTPSDACPSLLLDSARYASPADAAYYNGTLAHALDFDDTNHPAYAHPSAVLASAMLALVPRSQASGRAVIDAYIVGFEFFGKLGRALNTQHYKRGWHTTGTFGAVAAAASAGRLLGLNEDQMVAALGIAASSASGLRANFGSMTKPLHAGQAARNGVLGALLAQAGFTASDEAVEHRYGYLRVFNDGIALDEAPLTRMGQDLEILTEHGLALKPYAACGATHPGIEAAETLHAQLAGRAIRSVTAKVCEMAFAPLIHQMPNSPLEGKFSLHFCVAAALLHGPVTLGTFSDECVQDPKVRDLIDRVTMVLEPRWKDDGEFATEIEVQTEDGETLACFVPLAKGKPDRWFTPEQLRAKFTDCVGSLMTVPGLDAAWHALSSLDSAEGAARLLAALGEQGARVRRP